MSEPVESPPSHHPCGCPTWEHGPGEPCNWKNQYPFLRASWTKASAQAQTPTLTLEEALAAIQVLRRALAHKDALIRQLNEALRDKHA